MVPPADSARQERERKTNILLEFARSIPDVLQSLPANNSAALISYGKSLRSHTTSLGTVSLRVPDSKCREADAYATDAWNAATFAGRSVASPDDTATGAPPNSTITSSSAAEIQTQKQVTTSARLFAFLLVHAAALGPSKEPPDDARGNLARGVRVVKIGLKAARGSADVGDFQGVDWALQAVALWVDGDAWRRRVGDGEGVGGRTEAVGREMKRVRTEYFMLRILTSYRQDKIQLADNFYKLCIESAKNGAVSSRSEAVVLEVSTTEQLADILYDIGRDFLSKSQFDPATRWLERAMEVLAGVEHGSLIGNASELKCAVQVALIRCFLAIRDLPKANTVLGELEVNFPERIVVSLLKLEVLQAEENTDPERYSDVLARTMRSCVLNDNAFKTIMRHVHKLREMSASKAAIVLSDFVNLRLISAGQPNWVEKAVITYLWVVSKNVNALENLDATKALLDSVVSNRKGKFEVDATHASQTVLWKRIEQEFEGQRYEAVEAWCRVALHPLFEKSGNHNRAKIGRKIILCAIQRRDYAGAREAFYKMSQGDQDDPLTRFLMYKVALRSDDIDLASESLDLICKESRKDATILYACVLDAQALGDKTHAIKALQKVLEKYNYAAPSSVHLPALLRCTARLLISELEKNGRLDDEVAEELCDLFEGGARQASIRSKAVKADSHDFTDTELDWFSRTSYNLALKHCAEMHPKRVLRLASASIQFVDLMEDSSSKEHFHEHGLDIRRTYLHFIAASASTVYARAEDNIDIMRRHYATVREHAKLFKAEAITVVGMQDVDESKRSDIVSKHFQITKLELEAALRMCDWDALDGIFQESWRFEPPRSLQTLADLVIVIHEESVKDRTVDRRFQAVVLAMLEKIITTAHQASPSVAALSRWLRCLFQISLSYDVDVSLSCVEKASAFAASAKGTPDHYPPLELEWLATTAFNRAVDAYCAGDDAGCRAWAERALELAGMEEDGPLQGGGGEDRRGEGRGLARLMRERYAGLAFDG